MPFFSSAVNLT